MKKILTAIFYFLSAAFLAAVPYVLEYLDTPLAISKLGGFAGAILFVFFAFDELDILQRIKTPDLYRILLLNHSNRPSANIPLVVFLLCSAIVTSVIAIKYQSEFTGFMLILLHVLCIAYISARRLYWDIRLSEKPTKQ